MSIYFEVMSRQDRLLRLIALEEDVTEDGAVEVAINVGIPA